MRIIANISNPAPYPTDRSPQAVIFKNFNYHLKGHHLCSTPLPHLFFLPPLSSITTKKTMIPPKRKSGGRCQTLQGIKNPRKTLIFQGFVNLLISLASRLSLGELRSATSCFETVLREFLSCFPLILRAFPAFCLSVIRCADHKKRPFFIQQ